MVRIPFRSGFKRADFSKGGRHWTARQRAEDDALPRQISAGESQVEGQRKLRGEEALMG